MAKVLLPIGDAAETMDTLYAYYRIREAGYQVDVAGPERRTYAMVLHEIPPGWHITRETPGYHLKADIAFSEINEDDYAAVFLTGGRAPEYIRYDRSLLNAVRHCVSAGKPVCSVCHGVEIIAAADVIRGRKVTTVAKCQFDVETAGGVYVNEPCVRDGNLVSGRTWHDQHLYMPVFMEMIQQYLVATPQLVGEASR